MLNGNAAIQLEQRDDRLSGGKKQSYTILLAGSDQKGNSQLAFLLTEVGHTVLRAESAVQLTETLERQLPDLVMLDMEMPVAEAHDATKLIKKYAGMSFIPVIFMTSETNTKTMLSCLESGGDDYIHKPCIRCNHPLLSAKINALMRTRALYVELESQRNALEQHQQLMQAEQETARRLFDKFLHSDVLDSPSIQYLLSSMGMFNGDLLLAAHKPTGGLRIMVGDMTGHGLSAAVGAVPASEIFYTMTAKGYSVSDILIEINCKLKRILPTGNFCAVSLVDFDCSRNQIAIWNGGNPDILVFDKDRQTLKERICSNAVPLGIVESDALNTSVVYIDISPGDHIYLCSDGVTEARNKQGDMFGQQRLLDSIQHQGGRRDAFDRIKMAFESFISGAPVSDDTTLVEISCNRDLLERISTDLQQPRERSPTAWSVKLRLDADALRDTDPRPLLTQLVLDIQGMQKHRDRLFTILAELFSNALDHGVLGLDSTLKNTPDGFSSYFNLRKQKLANLEEGWISITLEHAPKDCSGELVITVEDSGAGFDYQYAGADLAGNVAHSGRGIALVRSLCQELTFEGKGNCVRAVYAWDNCEPSCSEKDSAAMEGNK